MNVPGVYARAAGRAKVGLAISVTNARAAISAFIISLHACGLPFVTFLQQKDRRVARSILKANRRSAPLGQLYLWIYWISQRSEALYFGFVGSRHCLGFDLELAVARTPLGSEIFRQG